MKNTGNYTTGNGNIYSLFFTPNRVEGDILDVSGVEWKPGIIGKTTYLLTEHTVICPLDSSSVLVAEECQSCREHTRCIAAAEWVTYAKERIRQLETEYRVLKEEQRVLKLLW